MPKLHKHSPFGSDRFGRAAERFARFFGTPRFIIGQTVVVLAWIALNAVAIKARWDPYPFILLNLVFSTQAAYAAPLILLAQTRQADRDKAAADERVRIAEAQRTHVESENEELGELIRVNRALLEGVVGTLAEVRAATCGEDDRRHGPGSA